MRKYDKERARQFSLPYLIQQIKTIQPKLIVCLGDTVAQTMFGDSEAHVKDLRGLWHIIMGYPTLVSYHPLAVRRRPNLMNHFIQDLEMLAHRYNNDKQVVD